MKETYFDVHYSLFDIQNSLFDIQNYADIIYTSEPITTETIEKSTNEI